MTANASGKINKGVVAAIKSISSLPPEQRSLKQVAYLDALLKELKAQPKRWEAYQDWGPGGPHQFLKKPGINQAPVDSPTAP